MDGMIYADTAALRRLADSMRAAAPRVWAGVRRSMAEAGEAVKADAAQRASFSSRVSGSGRVRVAGGNLTVEFGGGDAYIAVPIENRGQGDVTHPVFGNLRGQASTNRNSHPAFLHPAWKDNLPTVLGAVEASLVDGTRKVIEEGTA